MKWQNNISAPGNLWVISSNVGILWWSCLMALLRYFESRQTLSIPLDLQLYTTLDTQFVSSLTLCLSLYLIKFCFYIIFEMDGTSPRMYYWGHIWVNSDVAFSWKTASSLESVRIDRQKVLLIVDGWSCYGSSDFTVEDQHSAAQVDIKVGSLIIAGPSETVMKNSTKQFFQLYLHGIVIRPYCGIFIPLYALKLVGQGLVAWVNGIPLWPMFLG